MLVLSLIIVIKENMILKIRCLNGDSATRLDSTRLVSSRVESSRVEPSENICRVESSPARVESSRAESSRIFFDSFRSLLPVAFWGLGTRVPAPFFSKRYWWTRNQ
jgi:hypothetical protein